MKDLFLYNSDDSNFIFDITDTMDKKVELLKKHASQFQGSEGEDWVRNWNSGLGKEIEVSYAESFVRLTFD